MVMAGAKRRPGWLREHCADSYVQRAHAQGYRSRAAFKLIEIADRDGLLAAGSVVVDLGAAPGGWSQVAANRVLPAGRVVAVDRLSMASLPGVSFIEGDLRDPTTLQAITTALGGARADIVISDMAPDLSGVKVSDAAKVLDLGACALEVARVVLAPGGSLLLKTFHGEGLARLRAALGELFRQVAVRKPSASRARSAELYLLGRKFNP